MIKKKKTAPAREAEKTLKVNGRKYRGWGALEALLSSSIMERFGQ